MVIDLVSIINKEKANIFFVKHYGGLLFPILNTDIKKN